MAVPAPPEQTLRGQIGRDLAAREIIDLGIGQGVFAGRAQQMRRADIRIAWVGDGGLHRALQERMWVMDEVGVERIVARYQEDQRTLSSAAGPAGLLPERGDRSRETGDHDGIQPGDVDAQFECGGGRRAEQRTIGQPVLQFAAVLGQVSGSVGGDPVGQRGIDFAHHAPYLDRHDLGGPAGSDEGQRAGALHHQIGHDPSCLGGGRTPHRGAVLPAQLADQGRFPERDRAGSLR